MRFDVLEPHPTSAYSTLAPSIPCKDAVRGGSIQSNHPELMEKKSIHLAISVRMQFDKVR